MGSQTDWPGGRIGKQAKIAKTVKFCLLKLPQSQSRPVDYITDHFGTYFQQTSYNYHQRHQHNSSHIVSGSPSLDACPRPHRASLGTCGGSKQRRRITILILLQPPHPPLQSLHSPAIQHRIQCRVHHRQQDLGVQEYQYMNLSR